MPVQARRAAVSSMFLVLAFIAASGGADSQDVDLQWGVRIPMRDGVELAATLYRPAGQSEPLPVIFTLTPYIGDTYHPRAMYFARNGYVFALVDVRGRGSSGGSFDPFAQEAHDGHDVVEWLARQPWCSGKVATWGGSYAGYDQWATASRRVSKGSRLRLVVACPNSIQYQKNYNSGGVVADETAKDARTAHVALYHDADHPSALEIPVAP